MKLLYLTFILIFYRKLRDAFNSLDTANSGELSMSDVSIFLVFNKQISSWERSLFEPFFLHAEQVCMAFRILTNRDLSVDDLKNIVASSNGKFSMHFVLQILSGNERKKKKAD